MAEEGQEAKEPSATQWQRESESVIDKAMALHDKQDEETPADESSHQEESVEEKQEEQKESEDTTSKKSEDSKEKPVEIPKEFHKHPAWQRIMKERDEAKKLLEETKKMVLPKEEIEKFNQTISSPEYIRNSMKSQGYSDEAIDRKLGELGHKVEPKPQDDLQLVLS